MEQPRIEVEGEDLRGAVQVACNQLGLSGEHEIEYEFDKEHFRKGADTVRIFAWAKDPQQLAAVGFALEYLEGFLERVGVRDADVKVHEESDKTTLSIHTGRSANILIGQEGKNLEALQHVVATALAHQGHDYKVIIDVEEYRSRREMRLQEEAQGACRKVLNTGRNARSGPFNSYERRIIHLVVLDEFGDDLESRSVGQGKTKDVEIRVKKK